MAQISRFWASNGTGDGTALNQDAWTDFWFSLLGAGGANQGVFHRYQNQLAVSGSSSPLTIATGAAMARGFWFRNTTAETLAIPTPGSGVSTGGYVVLEADYDAQTVRIDYVLSASGTAALPTLTQTTGSGGIYQVPLASFVIATVDGAISSLADAREFLHPAFEIVAAMIAAATITKDKLAASTADATTIELDASAGYRLKDGGVSTAKLANDGVTVDKIGAGLLALIRRQGGDANDYTVTGGSNHTPGATRIQQGTEQISIASSTKSGSISITFPVAFGNKPSVHAIPIGTATTLTTGMELPTAMATNITTTGFTLRATRPNPSDTSSGTSVDVSWIAMGNE